MALLLRRKQANRGLGLGWGRVHIELELGNNEDAQGRGRSRARCDENGVRMGILRELDGAVVEESKGFGFWRALHDDVLARGRSCSQKGDGEEHDCFTWREAGRMHGVLLGGDGWGNLTCCRDESKRRKDDEAEPV
jgi:hypothetical protein